MTLFNLVRESGKVQRGKGSGLAKKRTAEFIANVQETIDNALIFATLLVNHY